MSNRTPPSPMPQPDAQAQRRRMGQSRPRPAKPKPGVADVKIDLDGIDQRILSVPMPPRRYMALQVGKAGTLLALEAPAADGPEQVLGQVRA